MSCLCHSYDFRDTNYHIGNHRFRVAAGLFRARYRAASRKNKPIVVEELVTSWRTSDKPPGRFLTRTNPELGDETLWHDVGHDVAMKKAAKILSEKTSPACKKGEGSSRKRQPVSCIPAQPPPKQVRTGTGSHHASVAAPVAAVSVSARLPHSSQAHQAPQDIPQMASLHPQAAEVSQRHLLQLALNTASPNLILRNVTAQNNVAFGNPAPSESSALMAALLSPDNVVGLPSTNWLRCLQAPQGKKHAAPGAGGTDVFMASRLNAAAPVTSLANAQGMAQANVQAMAQANAQTMAQANALLQASNSSTPAAAASGGVDLRMASLVCSLTDTPEIAQAMGQVKSQAALLQARNHATPGTGVTDVFIRSLLNSGSPVTSLAIAQADARAMAQAGSQAALLQANNRSIPADPGGIMYLSATSKAALLAEFLNSAPAAASQVAPQVAPQASLLQAALSGNTLVAASRMALLAQNNIGVNRATPVTTSSTTSDLIAELLARTTAASNREQRSDVQDRLRLATTSVLTQNQLTAIHAQNTEASLLARSIQALQASNQQQGNTAEKRNGA